MFQKLLAGGNLRSLGKSGSLISKIKSQKDFDDLFICLFHRDAVVVMRAVDAIEKITISNPGYLMKHKKEILGLSQTVKQKELKWHLALLIPRLSLNAAEFGSAWNMLTDWVKDKTNSRIVRVLSIQGLFELLKQKKSLEQDYNLTLLEVEQENIPSINARIRILRKLADKKTSLKSKKT